MEEVIRAVNRHIRMVERGMWLASRKVPKFPKGRLRVSNSGNQRRYYRMEKPGDTTGEYLPHAEMEIIKGLAQKEYTERFFKMAEKELLLMDGFLKKLEAKNMQDAYWGMPEFKRELVEPYVLSDEMYAKKWQAEKYNSNPYYPERKIYATQRGDKVRSKSEALIADTIYSLGIPYRYEEEVRLYGGGRRFPDFSLLNVARREKIYLEHFGLLDNKEYFDGCVEKLRTYAECGIYLGSNLLITFETSEEPLNTEWVRNMLRNAFPYAR